MQTKSAAKGTPSSGQPLPTSGIRRPRRAELATLLGTTAASHRYDEMPRQPLEAAGAPSSLITMLPHAELPSYAALRAGPTGHEIQHANPVWPHRDPRLRRTRLVDRGQHRPGRLLAQIAARRGGVLRSEALDLGDPCGAPDREGLRREGVRVGGQRDPRGGAQCGEPGGRMPGADIRA